MTRPSFALRVRFRACSAVSRSLSYSAFEAPTPLRLSLKIAAEYASDAVWYSKNRHVLRSQTGFSINPPGSTVNANQSFGEERQSVGNTNDMGQREFPR